MPAYPGSPGKGPLNRCACMCHSTTRGEINPISYKILLLLLLLLLQPFSSLFSRTTWVGRYQKGKTSLDLNEARDDGVLGWQWHQLDHMQIICTSLQTDNHVNTSSLFFTVQMLFLMPNQQCNYIVHKHKWSTCVLRKPHGIIALTPLVG